MKRILKILSAIAIGASFILTGVTPVVANTIPLTIDGVINCANPDNAITTTCRGEVPPPPVTPLPPGYVPAPVPPSATPTTPPPAPAVGSTITYSGDIAIDCALEASKSSPICAPRTNPDGSLNCAQADNAITTTCWERAQADKKSGVNPVPSDVDCALEKFKNYPVCTGVAPQAVIDYEKSRANAAPLPEMVNCADPMLAQTSACTNRTTTDLPADCALSENANLPRCQPMTLPDGSINCAQPDNAITTTCWEQAQVLKSFGALTAVNCNLPGYLSYPACTGIKPQAVLDFEKTSSVKKLNQDTATALTETATVKTLIETTTVKTLTETAAIAEASQEAKVSGSVDLKSRNTKTTVLQIDLDLAKAKVKVIATKKGSPTLTQSVSADSNGDKTVTFKRNLKGYTIKIVVDGETIDSLKI